MTYISSIKLIKVMVKKVELITWSEEKEDFDRTDNNDGREYGLNYLDENGEIDDREWFDTMEERNDATKGYEVINYMG